MGANIWGSNVSSQDIRSPLVYISWPVQIVPVSTKWLRQQVQVLEGDMWDPSWDIISLGYWLPWTLSPWTSAPWKLALDLDISSLAGCPAQFETPHFTPCPLYLQHLSPEITSSIQVVILDGRCGAASELHGGSRLRNSHDSTTRTANRWDQSEVGGDESQLKLISRNFWMQVRSK